MTTTVIEPRLSICSRVLSLECYLQAMKLGNEINKLNFQCFREVKVRRFCFIDTNSLEWFSEL